MFAVNEDKIPLGMCGGWVAMGGQGTAVPEEDEWVILRRPVPKPLT